MAHPQIHITAIVEDGAIIGEGTRVGPFVFIASGVQLGKNNIVSKGASIYKNVKIGNDNIIGESTVIGIDPSNTAFDRMIETHVTIGNGNVIKEFVTIERSATVDGKTIIGSQNLLMVNTHIAHDCVLKDEIVIANLTALAGHVSIDSKTFISGGCFFHQFSRIGEGVMVAAASKVSSDVPPYILVEGYTGRYRGLNIVGLKRAGFTVEERSTVKIIYEYLYRGTVSQGMKAIAQMPPSLVRDKVLKFLEKIDKRPLIRKGVDRTE